MLVKIGLKTLGDEELMLNGTSSLFRLLVTSG